MASTTSGSLPMIDKLSGCDDYKNWKFAMRMYLKHEDLWDYVDGNVKPDKFSQKMDEKALAKICLMIKPELYVHVREAKSAKDAWQSLAKTFEQRGLMGRLSLQRQLVACKLNNFSSMSAYVSEIMTLSQRLSDIDAPVDDEYLAVILLSGLPPLYDPMIMALESCGHTITTQLVKSKLLMEEHRREEEKAESAFAAKDQTTTQRKKFWFRCNKCNRPGHKRAECPDKVPEIKGQLSRAAGKKQQPVVKALLTACNVGTVNVNKGMKPVDKSWFIDSGATCHMSNCKTWMSNFKCVNTEVSMANDDKVCSKGIGNVSVHVNEGSKLITNVAYVPSLSTNLLSVSKVVGMGMVVVFSKEGCKMYHENDCIIRGNVRITGSESNGMYKLDQLHASVSNSAMFVPNSKSFYNLWHRRLGHLGKKGMREIKNIVSGVKFTDVDDEPCVTCAEGKQSRTPFVRCRKARREGSEELLGLIHTDLCGPMQTNSLSGCLYMLLFVDDYSRKIFVYFLRHKSETMLKFLEFKRLVENQTGKTIKVLRSDGGGEYISKNFREFLVKSGIKHEITMPHTPEQNGTAERTIRSICEMARCMMSEANSPKNLWAEACNTAVYLKNRCPHAALEGKTPEEMWSGKVPDLRHLRVFGCKAMVLVPKGKRLKWDPKSAKHTFVGYCDDSTDENCYRLLNKNNKLIRARDVKFLENSVNGNSDEAVDLSIPLTGLFPSENHNAQNVEFFQHDVHSVDDEETDHEMLPDQGVVEADIGTEPRYPLRQRKPKEFPDYVLYQAACRVLDDPISVNDALSRPDKEKWFYAMCDD